MERATGTEVYGCGSTQSTDITLNIQTTTGGNFSISLNGKHTVEHLKKVVSKKLKVCKDRICLLHRERQLRDGTLEENGLLDGARVILLPSVETGLLSQRTENSVMQALESLNENQVNDFLTGKSPLNLTMRLGDHMMLIQLQLSTLNSSSRSLRTSTPSKAGTAAPARTVRRETRDPASSQAPADRATRSEELTTEKTDKSQQDAQKRTLIKKQDFELLKNAFELYRSMTEDKYTDKADDDTDDKDESEDTANCTLSDISDDTSMESEQSPIKSLSNLVSSPIDAATAAAKESIANSVRSSLMDLLSKSKANAEPKPSSSKIAMETDSVAAEADAEAEDSTSEDESFADQSSFLTESTIDEYPMESLFNSAVDKGLFQEQDESMMDREISNLATMSHGAQECPAPGALPSFQSINEPLKTKRFQYLLHKTSKFKHPIVQNKQKTFMQSVVNKHKKRMQIRQDSDLAQPSTSSALAEHSYSRKLILQPSRGQTDDQATPSTSKQVFRVPEAPKKPRSMTPEVDNKNLIEASKNLTQKLKKLSKEVLTNKIDFKRAEECVRSKIGPGAVIESMKHHGKGIYSGTFSGTLNPALQDRYGRPKRDISTIIHILNDLLCASQPIALAPKEPPGRAEPCAAACRDTCADCAGKLSSELCTKCDEANTLALENSKTKCKLEQLRLVMQQKKQRREARKLRTVPYSPPPRNSSPEPPTDEVETAA